MNSHCRTFMSLIMKLNRNVVTGQCGENHYTDSGELVSPNYPEPYTTNVSCIWTLTVQEKDTINLIFIEMDLEDNQDCVYDFVEVTMANFMLMLLYLRSLKPFSYCKFGSFCEVVIFAKLRIYKTIAKWRNHSVVY